MGMGTSNEGHIYLYIHVGPPFIGRTDNFWSHLRADFSPQVMGQM